MYRSYDQLAVNIQTSLAFIGGAICSLLAGRFGMNAATKANVRTANAAKEKGKLRLEGKEYEMQDGDVVNFRFNV